MRIHTFTEWELTDDPNTYILKEDHWYEYTGAVALADRSAQQQGQQAERTATNVAGGYGTTASQVGGTLIPTLERDVTNAPGFSPEDLNAMLVGGEQGAGGAAAGITGQAGLQAARTRNTGAFGGIADMAARRKLQQESQNALNVQAQNAQLKQQQRAEALRGLQGVYGTDVGAQLKSMGLIPEDIGTELAAGRQGWLQNTEGALGTLGNIGLGAAKAAGFG
jgi:hypothetical protein